MSHIPGPWEVRPSQYEPEAYDITATGVGAIAIVKHIDNAKLIAAAPKLLEVLKAIVHGEDSHGFCFYAASMSSYLRRLGDAAIKEATGD